MPFLHFLLNVFLNEVTVAAIPGHEVENDDAPTMFVEVEPAGFIDVVRLNVAAIQRLKHDVGDGCGFCVRLEQLIHAVKHRKRSKRDGAKHHQGNDKRLPCGLFFEHTEIGLVKQSHTIN